MWHATYDIWHMTYVIWHMTYGIWHNGVESAENAVSLLLTSTPTQQQNFIPFLLIYSHELLPADWLKWWLLIDVWVMKTYHLRSFIICLGDPWPYIVLIFSFWFLDSSRYMDPRHTTNYNLPYLTEIHKTVRLWIKTVITDHAMGLYFNLVPRSLVDEAEGEIWPNPICITWSPVRNVTGEASAHAQHKFGAVKAKVGQGRFWRIQQAYDRLTTWLRNIRSNL